MNKTTLRKKLKANIARYAAFRELDDEERDEYLADLPTKLEERLLAHIAIMETVRSEDIEALLRGKVYSTPERITNLNAIVDEALKLYAALSPED